MWNCGYFLVHHLQWVGDGISEWGEAQQDHVSLVGLGLLKHGVSPMAIVQHPQGRIALVDPGGERRVLKAGVLTSISPVPIVPTTCF